MIIRVLPLVFALLAFVGRAAAAPGDLDPTFGSGGKVTTAIGASHDKGQAIAIDDNGRIVVAGRSYSTSLNDDFALARYDATGSLDPTFGSGGKTTTTFSVSADVAFSVAIDGSDRIVVAGYSTNGSSHDFAVARYDASGNLDSTFGSGGKVTTDIGSLNDEGRSVAIDGSGRIVVAGSVWTGYTYDFALVRYDASGNLDPTFGSGGTVTTPVGASDDVLLSLAIDGSGRIVVAGQSNVAINNGLDLDVALVRYDASGNLDPTFGNGGKVTTAIGSSEDTAFSVAIDDSGRIVVAGRSNNGTDNDVALARYDQSGSLDPAFGNGGKVVTAIGSGDDEGISVAIDDSGRIVVAGSSNSGSISFSDFDFALVRYDASGNLDPTFGSGGTVTTAIGPRSDVGNSVTVDGNGHILVAGSSWNGTNYDFAVVRYLGTDCGDAVVESGEECDDGNATSGDCCSPTCLFESSTTVCRVTTAECDVTETCTGSSGTCPINTFVSSGTSCTDDGNVCTNDQCNGSGACTHTNNTASCDDGLFCTGADICNGGSCSVHAGDPCVGGPECANTCEEDLDSCNVPAGTACTDDSSACSLDICDGSGACTHPAGNAGATCRSSAGDCDVAEVCDGTNPTCPTDLFQPSSYECRSAAGECDVPENCSGSGADCPADGFVAPGIACTDDGQPCTSDACDGDGTCEHVALPDTDVDSVCDAQDSCTNVGGARDFDVKSKLVLTRINTETTPGNDGLRLSAAFDLPSASSFSALNPIAHGARVVMLNQAGEVELDQVLPGGAYIGSGSRGWKANMKGTVWQYLDRTTSPLSGITTLKVTDKNKTSPGRVTASLTGKKAMYPVISGDQPLQLVVVLGNQTDAITGYCGESAFTPTSCGFNGTQNSLVCRQ